MLQSYDSHQNDSRYSSVYLVQTCIYWWHSQHISLMNYVTVMPTFMFILQLKCLFYVRGTLNSSWNINSCSAKQSEDCKNLEQACRGKLFTINTCTQIFRKFDNSMFWRHCWLRSFFNDHALTQKMIEADILWTIHFSTHHTKEQTLWWDQFAFRRDCLNKFDLKFPNIASVDK